MYGIQLSNDQVIVRHIDQLRHRVCHDGTSSSEDIIPETGASLETMELESAETGHDSSETSGALDSHTKPLPAQTQETGTWDVDEQTGDPSVATNTTSPLPGLDQPELAEGGSTTPRSLSIF